ncbi:MAG: prephenate dehydrogenase/arogenate dehydrogenase family protein [Pseudomonadota bacterium]
MHIDRLAVVGTGLIGGSLAAALKQAGVADEIIGLGRRRATLEQARALGLIDAIADAPAQLAGAQMIVLATPVAQMGPVLEAIAPHLDGKTIVTDAGSTKGDVIAAARRALGRNFSRFVAGHPVAGAENSGPQAARADLFIGRHVVLCPEAETDADALARVTALWQATGAQVVHMDAARHDRIFAAVSHLPHLAAFALVDELAARPDAGDFFRYAAGGFRDFTRIAASHPEMWRDIALANREALLAELSAYMNNLAEIAAALEKGDAAALERIFSRASQARRNWGTK